MRNIKNIFLIDFVGFIKIEIILLNEFLSNVHVNDSLTYS